RHQGSTGSLIVEACPVAPQLIEQEAHVIGVARDELPVGSQDSCGDRMISASDESNPPRKPQIDLVVEVLTPSLLAVLAIMGTNRGQRRHVAGPVPCPRQYRIARQTKREMPRVQLPSAEPHSVSRVQTGCNRTSEEALRADRGKGIPPQLGNAEE